jgi:hypothetical protein
MGEIRFEGHIFLVKYNLLDTLEMLQRQPSPEIGQFF